MIWTYLIFEETSKGDSESFLHCLITIAINKWIQCIIKKDQTEFFNEKGTKINKKVLELSSEEEKYDKGDYKHFMAKEIDEQPNTIKNCVNEYIDKINKDINIFNFPFKEERSN